MTGEPPLFISAAEYQAVVQAEAAADDAARNHKYRAKSCVHDGIRFPSQKERDRYINLTRLQRAGHIRNLVYQKRYRLEVNGVKVADYVADFVYEERSLDGVWRTVVEDTKGFETPEFKIKARLFRALYPALELRVT